MKKWIRSIICISLSFLLLPLYSNMVPAAETSADRTICDEDEMVVLNGSQDPACMYLYDCYGNFAGTVNYGIMKEGAPIKTVPVGTIFVSKENGEKVVYQMDNPLKKLASYPADTCYVKTGEDWYGVWTNYYETDDPEEADNSEYSEPVEMNDSETGDSSDKTDSSDEMDSPKISGYSLQVFDQNGNVIFDRSFHDEEGVQPYKYYYYDFEIVKTEDYCFVSWMSEYGVEESESDGKTYSYTWHLNLVDLAENSYREVYTSQILNTENYPHNTMEAYGDGVYFDGKLFDSEGNITDDNFTPDTEVQQEKLQEGAGWMTKNGPGYGGPISIDQVEIGETMYTRTGTNEIQAVIDGVENTWYVDDNEKPLSYNDDFYLTSVTEEDSSWHEVVRSRSTGEIVLNEKVLAESNMINGVDFYLEDSFILMRIYSSEKSTHESYAWYYTESDQSELTLEKSLLLGSSVIPWKKDLVYIERGIYRGLADRNGNWILKVLIADM